MKKETRQILNPIIGQVKSLIYRKPAGYFKSARYVIEALWKKHYRNFEPTLPFIGSDSNFNELMIYIDKQLKKKIWREEKLYKPK